MRHKLPFPTLLLLGMILMEQSLPAQTAPLIPRSLFFTAKTMGGNVQLSPDGHWIAYVKNEASDGDLMVCPAVENAVTQAKSAVTQTLGSWGWTQRNELIVCQKSGDQWKLKLHNPVSGKTADITPFPFQNARLLATSPEMPDQAAFSFQSETVDNDGVFLLTLETHATQKLAEREGFNNFYFDKQLVLRAGTKPNTTGGHTFYRRKDNQWVMVADYDWCEGRISGVPEGVVSVDAAGQHCWFVDREGLDKLALKKLDLASGAVETVAESPDADVFWAGAAVHPRTGEAQAVVTWFGETRRLFPDPAIQRDFNYLQQKLGGDVGMVTRSADDTRWLVRNMDGTPFVYWLYDRKQSTLTRMFSDFPQGDAIPWAKRHSFTVKARDGLKLPCCLYLPADSDKNGDGKPDKPLPTLLYVHGGPWVGALQNIWQANRHFQFLASRGYAVIVTEFRGASGYGQDFIAASNREWGGKMHTDLLDIAKAALSRGVAKKGKLGIWGWSYGGYATAAALAFSPNTFECGMAMYGVFDLEEYCKLPGASNEYWRMRTGDLRTKEGRELLHRHSPQNFVDKITKPLLITHGSLDKMVPQVQSDSMAVAMRQAGKPFSYFYYPSEGHDYADPKTWESFWAVAEEFLQQHLGGRAEPAGDAVANGRMVLVENALKLKTLDR